jgi:hypothetical protein
VTADIADLQCRQGRALKCRAPTSRPCSARAYVRREGAHANTVPLYADSAWCAAQVTLIWCRHHLHGVCTELQLAESTTLGAASGCDTKPQARASLRDFAGPARAPWSLCALPAALHSLPCVSNGRLPTFFTGTLSRRGQAKQAHARPCAPAIHTHSARSSAPSLLTARGALPRSHSAGCRQHDRLPARRVCTEASRVHHGGGGLGGGGVGGGGYTASARSEVSD